MQSSNPLSPFTIQSNIFVNGTPNVVVGLGANQIRYQPPSAATGSYWIMALDRTSLKAVYNIVQASNTDVPAGITPFLNDQFILVVVTNALKTTEVPQGSFFDFLDQYGGGRELQRVVNAGEQLGCGQFGHTSYCLVSVLSDPAKHPAPTIIGFETSDLTDSAILTINLMSVNLPTGILWTPVALSD